MDQTGSLDKSLTVAAAADLSRHRKMRESKEGKAFTSSLPITLGLLKKIGKSKDVDLIARSEASLLKLELQTIGAQDPSVIPSLKAAILDLDEVKKSLETVRNPVLYQAAETTHHRKKKTSGFVQDGCHDAINSHITRLGNNGRAIGISVPEKNILTQRQENMRICKKLYIELQYKALGIEAPNKSKSRGR